MMEDAQSPHVPLLSSEASTSAAETSSAVTTMQDGAGSAYKKQGNSSRRRSRSSSSGLAKREDAMRRATAGEESDSYAQKNEDSYDVDGEFDQYVDESPRSSKRHPKGQREGGAFGESDEDDEDDIVAISDADNIAAANGSSSSTPGYRQIDGSRFRFDQGKTNPEVIRRLLIVLALIASWFLFSTLMNLYNSWLFSKKRHNFTYPLFVTSMHMFVQFGLSSILMCVCHRNRKIVPRRRNGKRARPEARDWAVKVVPCALATALDIGLSNLSLKTITLTFYTMCKSSNLAFVLFFAFLFKLEKMRWSLIGIIALITIGVIMMVAAETEFVLEGAVQVLTASAMGGLRWALTQVLLNKKKMGMNNPIATIFWLSPLMGFFMIVSSAIVEDWWGMFTSSFFQDFSKSIWSVTLMIAPGMIAFLMTLSEFALIQRTSVITLSVAGIFKEIATIMLSSSVFGDELTPINVTGLCIALSGIALYNYLKYRLMMIAINSGKSLKEEQEDDDDDDDDDSYTEMNGNPLPAASQRARTAASSNINNSNTSSTTATSGQYSQVPLAEEGQIEFDADAEELTKAEMEKRRQRDEEADMPGWANSGFTRTGGGYDDGEDHIR